MMLAYKLEAEPQVTDEELHRVLNIILSKEGEKTFMVGTKRGHVLIEGVEGRNEEVENFLALVTNGNAYLNTDITSLEVFDETVEVDAWHW